MGDSFVSIGSFGTTIDFSVTVFIGPKVLWSNTFSYMDYVCIQITGYLLPFHGSGLKMFSRGLGLPAFSWSIKCHGQTYERLHGRVTSQKLRRVAENLKPMLNGVSPIRILNICSKQKWKCNLRSYNCEMQHSLKRREKFLRPLVVPPRIEGFLSSIEFKVHPSGRRDVHNCQQGYPQWPISLYWWYRK